MSTQPSDGDDRARLGPALDAHAHIAPDVTEAQIDALGDTVVFAMTRSISEARLVVGRNDSRLAWGLGVHPGVAAALDEYDEGLFARAVPHFAVIGEIGLDRRGDQEKQRAVLKSILDVTHSEPVVLSLHSTGRTAEVLDLLAARPHPGAILHWFNGTPDDVAQGVELGCYFSVNAAMDPGAIGWIPPGRLLMETDFPSSRRRTQARLPGDVKPIEDIVHEVHGVPARETSRVNALRLLTTTGAFDRLHPAARHRLNRSS